MPLLGETVSPIQFDVPSVISAVPLDESRVAHILPNTRHFEVVIPVSTLVRSRQSLPDYQLWFFVQFPHAPVQVVDYAPQTELTSPYLGPLQIDRQHESTQRLGVSLSSKIDPWGTAQANSELSGKQKEQRRLTEAPPMMLLQTSGTVDRGTGVYFKFRPSRQTTLEGSRELKIVIEVPSEWCTSLARVVCRAETLDEDRVCLGQVRLPVAVYEIGHSAAAALAAEYAVAERRFRSQWRQAALSRREPSAPRLGLEMLGAWPLARSRRPAPQWDALIDGLAFRRGGAAAARELIGSLPDALRPAAQRLHAAAEAIHELSAHPATAQTTMTSLPVAAADEGELAAQDDGLPDR